MIGAYRVALPPWNTMLGTAISGGAANRRSFVARAPYTTNQSVAISAAIEFFNSILGVCNGCQPCQILDEANRSRSPTMMCEPAAFSGTGMLLADGYVLASSHTLEEMRSARRQAGRRPDFPIAR
jgi:hypothetical protein